MSVNRSVRQAVRHVLMVGALAAIGVAGHVAIAAQAQPEQATVAKPTKSSKKQPTQLQEVVVTGSLIRQSSLNTPSPVSVISATDLTDSGFSNVSSVLQSLSSNGAGSLSQAFPQAFALGGSGIALRGLTVGSTLSLIDGERMVPYPLADDGERDFVDLSAIPMDVVSRIEILKDGGSAEYGSDAVAGVVNVILRKTYVGLSGGAEIGSTIHADGTTEHIHAIAGIGHLSTDGYNAYVAVEFRHQDPIRLQNRSGLWANTNWGPYGGNDQRPGANNPAVGAGATSTSQLPYIPGGYVLNPATNLFDSTSVFLNPNSSYLPSNCSGSNATYTSWYNNQCVTPTNQEIQPQSVTFDILGRFTKTLPHNWLSITTASLFRSEAEQVLGGVLSANNANPFVNVAGGIGIPTSIVTQNNVLLPVGAPNNPFNQPAIFYFNFPQYIPSGQGVTNTYRIFETLRGKAFGWRIHGSAGYMYDELTQTLYGAVMPSVLNQDITSGVNFTSLTNQQINALFPAEKATDSNKLTVVDVHGSRNLMQLPGGPLAFALGAGYYHLSKYSPAPLTVAEGLQAGNNAYVEGIQTNYNAYAELEGKPIKNLSLDVAYRFDHFNTYGHSFTPKYSVKYTPFNWLTLRGTYTKGFRAPNPAEAGTSGALFYGYPAYDTTLCPGGSGSAPGVFPSQCGSVIGLQVANPKLKPVTSHSYDFGFILQPTHNVYFSADYWDITVSQDIQSGTNLLFLGALTPAQISADYPLVRGPVVTLACNPGTSSTGFVCPASGRAVTPVGPVAYQPIGYYNATTTSVNGLDLSFRTNMDLGRYGSLVFKLNESHTFHYIFGAAGNKYDLAGTHGPTIVSGDTGNPKDRARASLKWRYRGLRVALSANFTGHFNLLDPTLGIPTCAAGLPNSGHFPFSLTSVPNGLQGYCEVSHFTYYNLYAKYWFNSRLNAHISVVNLLNTAPSVDLQTYGAGAAAYSTLEQVGAVGTMVMVGFHYDFE